MKIYSLVKIPENLPEDLMKITEGKICGAIDLELEMLPEKEYGYKEAKSADTFDKLTGTLVIPEGYTHMSENCLWALHPASIKRLEIPASIRKIHDKTLVECSQLQEITVAEANNHYQALFGTLCSLDEDILLWPVHRTLTKLESRCLQVIRDEKPSPELKAIQTFDKWSLSKKKVLKPEEELCERAKKYYLGVDGYSKDEAKALEIFRETANYYQYAPACNFIGEIYLRRINYERAYNWYLKSALLGDAEGNCMIGYFYDIGLWVSRDEEAAQSYYVKAVESKEFSALTTLAIKFQNGWGIPKEEEIAANIFEMVAERGDMMAQYQLGLCYLNGLGRKRDKKNALKWLGKAIKQGCEEAKEALKNVRSLKE